MTTKVNANHPEVEYTLAPRGEAEKAAVEKGLVLRLLGAPLVKEAGALRRAQKDADTMAAGLGKPGGLVVVVANGKYQGAIASKVGQGLVFPGSPSDVRRFSAVASERITALLQQIVLDRATAKDIRKQRRTLAASTAAHREKRNGIIETEVAGGRGTPDSKEGYSIDASREITAVEKKIDAGDRRHTALTATIKKHEASAAKSGSQMHEQIACAACGRGLFEAAA